MYGGSHSPLLHQQGDPQKHQQQAQQQQQQQIKQHSQGAGLTPWAPPASICPPSPFDTFLNPPIPQDGQQRSIASPFDFPSIPNSGSTFLSSMSGGAQSATSLSNRVPPASPFDRPGAAIGAGRVQQLLQNSQFGGHSLGRPPQLPMDRAARSPFDVALGQSHRSLQTASSGSVLRMGGGLPVGESFRSLERSLGSECSPATSYGTHEGGDDLDGVTQANVERQQQMYVRYSGMQEAVPCTEWSARESLAAEAGAMGDVDLRQRAEDVPLGVTLRIMSAPAAFALPMVQRKPFKPAFQVRMEVSYRKQLYMPVTMEVHPVNDALYGKMEQWAPDSEKMQAELEGNRLSKTLNAQGMSYSNGLGLDVASTPHNNLHLEDFRFTDLKWAKSSRMSKRWLVFFVRIKNDIVYLVYKLPTVVISRRTDQYSKAHEILTGVAASAAKRPRTSPMVPTTAAPVPPPGGSQRGDSSGALDAPKLAHASTAPEGAFRKAIGQQQVVDGAYIRQWIHMRYKACNFRRYMSESDMSALLHEAGVYPGAPGSSADAFPVDAVKWEYFKNWFLKALNVLLHAGKMWEATDPHAICGFAVTRETAEALLMVQPTGTFLVRLSSQPGALAISCCVEQAPGSQAFVDHLLVDHVDLVNRDLPSWVHAHIYATHLLDFLGEKRHHKDLIFGVPAPKMQQDSPRGQPEAPHPQSPRQGHFGMAQSSPPNLPSPLPMRSPGSPSPSNMPLDHLLMLANLTNNQNEDWAASPHAGNSPSMSNAGNCSRGAFHDAQHLPDIPERELSLDVLTMEQLGAQRLESLGALGGFSRQDLGSIGNLESLGLSMGNRGKADSLSRFEHPGQRLDFMQGHDHSGSLDNISRQLLGSLGNLPENDPVLRDMLASMASAPATVGEADGRGIANMDMSHEPWGSLAGMTVLNQRGNSLLTDLDPVRMASARGSLPPLGGSSFSFNNTMMDAEMTDAPHMGQHPHDPRFTRSVGQQQQHSPQQHSPQQHSPQQFTFQDTYWDPLNDDSQGFQFGGPFGHGFNSHGGNQR